MKLKIMFNNKPLDLIKVRGSDTIYLEKCLFPDSDRVYLESEEGYLWKRTITGDSPNIAEFKRI